MSTFFSESEERELAVIRCLHSTNPDQPVQFSARQLSIASTLPIASIGAALDRAARAGELVPLYPDTRIFRAGDLSRWAKKHADATAARLGAAISQVPGHQFADPTIATNNYLRQLLSQAKS